MVCTFFGYGYCRFASGNFLSRVFPTYHTVLFKYWIDLSPPDSISIFYQVPQYVFMSLAEALISVTALSKQLFEPPPFISF
eukprot:UN05077